MFLLLSLFYYFYFSIVGIYIIFLPKVLSELGYSASEIGILFAAAPLVRFILPFLFIKGLGKVRLFGSLGFIIVALVLVKFLSFAYVALNFLFVMSFMMALFAYFVQKYSAVIKMQNELYENDISLIRDWKLWFGLLLMQMSFGSFYNFFTIYETDRGISLDMTIYLWSFGVIVEVLMLFFQGRFLRANLLSVLQVTILVTVLRWFLVFAYPTTLEVLFFAQSLHAFSFALFHSAAISYLFMHYQHKSLAQQFFSGITYGLGGLIGALLAGFVYEFYPKYLFLSSSGIALGAFVMIYLYSKEHTPRM